MKNIFIFLLLNLLCIHSKICGNKSSDVFSVNTYKDIKSLSDCSYLNGSLLINGLDNINNFKLLSKLNKISGYLHIKNTYSVNNLEGLHNIKNIEGLHLFKNKSIIIGNNTKDGNGLCYVNLVDWSKITLGLFDVGRQNDNCPLECSNECKSGYCFGPGNLCQKCFTNCDFYTNNSTHITTNSVKESSNKNDNDYFIFLVVGISLGVLLLCFLIFFIIMICKMTNDNKAIKEKDIQDKLKYQQTLNNDINEYRNPLFEPKKSPVYNDSIRIHKKRLNKSDTYKNKVYEIDDNNNLEFDKKGYNDNIENESNSKNNNLKTDKIEKNDLNNTNTKSNIDLGITKPRRRQSFDNTYGRNHLTLLEELKLKLPHLNKEQPIPTPRKRMNNNDENLNICVTDF